MIKYKKYLFLIIINQKIKKIIKFMKNKIKIKSFRMNNKK